MTSAPSTERERGLHKELSKAQIVMIGLGGAIGTGLFMGSGIAIAYAGPAVILSYAIAGFAALVMVFSLSEMAVVHPTAGSFGTYAEMYLNPWAGFVVRYTYWISQVIADRRRGGRRGRLHDLLVSRTFPCGSGPSASRYCWST